MSVSDSRRVASNPQVVRRRRVCVHCDGLSFQTDERPRLWLTDEDGAEPLYEAVRVMLGDAAATSDLELGEREQEQVIRLVAADLLSDGIDRPGHEELRPRLRNVLRSRGLELLSEHFDEPSGRGPLRIAKRGSRRSEAFERHKLLGSVQAAAKPFLASTEVLALVEEIEFDLGARVQPLAAEELQAIVSERLRQRDERAFLRYVLGGYAADRTLKEFLDRIAPVAQVIKRNGAVVLFEKDKLTKSIRRSFVARRRDDHSRSIAEFVAAEERRVRDKMAIDGEPEPTANIGRRVMDWLFDLDEIAWANYWLAFASDHEQLAGTSPTQQLARAHEDMRQKRDVLAAFRPNGVEDQPARSKPRRSRR